MALPPPNLPSVSRVVAHWSGGASGATAINVFHVLSSGATALDVFTRFSTAWTAAMTALSGTGTRVDSLDITKLDNLTATETFSTVGTQWDGSSSPEMSPQVAALIKYTTGFRGLASVGHTYVPFIAEAAQENGRIVAAAFPGFRDGWVAFVNTLSSQTIPLQVVSAGREANPSHDPPIEAAPATNHTVTAVAADIVLSTIRGRQSRLRG